MDNALKNHAKNRGSELILRSRPDRSTLTNVTNVSHGCLNSNPFKAASQYRLGVSYVWW